MVAAFEGHGNTIAKRPQQIRGPGSERDDDVARRDSAIRKHHAALDVPCGDVHEVNSLL